MSNSFQSFPAPDAPVTQGFIYPTTTTASNIPSGVSSQNLSNDDHSSSGSFGMVFVVLAIILVISAVACVLGRFCGKNKNKSHNSKAHKSKNNKHNGNYGHDQYGNDHGNNNKHMNHPSNSSKGSKHGSGRVRDPDLEFGFRSKEGDITLGFDPKIKIPSAKVANHHGDHNMGRMGPGPGMGQGMGRMGPGMMGPGMMGPGMGPGPGMGRGMEHHGESRDYP